jgi:prolyl oligopeptidase
MIRASLAALALSCSFATVVAAHEQDPYLWLEDIEGKRALDWVKRANAATDALILDRPGFESDRRRARAILDDDRQIAMPGEVMGAMRPIRAGSGGKVRSMPGWRASPNGRR